MTVLDNVIDLISRISPQVICDDCIAKKLKLSLRQHANHKTRELATRSGYRRSQGRCDFCHNDKLVIRIA